MFKRINMHQQGLSLVSKSVRNLASESVPIVTLVAPSRFKPSSRWDRLYILRRVRSRRLVSAVSVERHHSRPAVSRYQCFPHRPNQYKQGSPPKKHHVTVYRHFQRGTPERSDRLFSKQGLYLPCSLGLSTFTLYLFSERRLPESEQLFMTSIISFQVDCFFLFVITLDCLAVSMFLCWLYSSNDFLIRAGTLSR